MKYGQVFVRGKNITGEWDSIDVLRMDNKSFRAFVINVLFKAGLVVGIKDEVLEKTGRKDIFYKEAEPKHEIK